jgi:hypothetical protein
VKLLCHVHGYPPAKPSGAEHALRALAEWLVGRGHAVTVFASRDSVPGEQRGVRVVGNQPGFREIEQLYREADAVLTHLDLARTAIGMAKVYRKPCVFWAHSGISRRYSRVRSGDVALVVYNAHTACAEDRLWKGPWTVLYPPVFREEYGVEASGDAVALVNVI